jgi:hypothetical protein
MVSTLYRTGERKMKRPEHHRMIVARLADRPFGEMYSIYTQVRKMEIWRFVFGFVL